MNDQTKIKKSYVRVEQKLVNIAGSATLFTESTMLWLCSDCNDYWCSDRTEGYGWTQCDSFFFDGDDQYIYICPTFDPAACDAYYDDGGSDYQMPC